LSALEGQQGAVLVAMHARRSADSLAKLVGLPVEQVRGLLRTHRAPAQASPAGDGGTRPGVAPVSTPASAPVPAHPPAPGRPMHRPGGEDRGPEDRERGDEAGGRGEQGVPVEQDAGHRPVPSDTAAAPVTASDPRTPSG
jgi:hypothetical protein